MTEPIRQGGLWRKRWTYVAAFAYDLMVCAARVEVGPFGQTFWAILDRRTGELIERTRTRLPLTRGEVRGDASLIEIRSPSVEGTLRVGPGSPIEVTCKTEGGGEVWTRKRAGVPVACDLNVGFKAWRLEALGVTDETLGFHPRHTVWNWSAGIGETSAGVPVGWNLVQGINDPPTGSERAIWVAGEPTEPDPVWFDGLDAIHFADGSALHFNADAERRREESRLGIKYSYRQPFGTFAGTFQGGIGIRGVGVMEHHDAVW